MTGADPHMETLLDQVAQADQPVKVRPDRAPPFYRVLGQIGDATAMAGRTLLGLVGFFGALLISFWSVITHPRRFRLNAVTQQFELLGIHSLGIIGLMSFLVGIVIAQQGAVQLRQFGAEVFTVNLVGRSSVKELGNVGLASDGHAPATVVPVPPTTTDFSSIAQEISDYDCAIMSIPSGPLTGVAAAGASLGSKTKY